jgi:hypothetical protein
VIVLALRKLRLQSAGLPVHILQGGNNPQACFFADEDYLFFLDALSKLAKRFHFSGHSYALTPPSLLLVSRSYLGKKDDAGALLVGGFLKCSAALLIFAMRYAYVLMTCQAFSC